MKLQDAFLGRALIDSLRFPYKLTTSAVNNVNHCQTSQLQ